MVQSQHTVDDTSVIKTAFSVYYSHMLGVVLENISKQCKREYSNNQHSTYVCLCALAYLSNSGL